MSQTPTQFRYDSLLTMISRLIIPTDGKAVFSLKNCDKEFIKDLAKTKFGVAEEIADVTFFTFKYAENITINLTSQ